MEVGASTHLTHSRVLCVYDAGSQYRLWKQVPQICPTVEHLCRLWYLNTDTRLHMQLCRWVPAHTCHIMEYHLGI